MLESLFAEINIPSAEIEVKMSPGVANTFTTTISQNSSKILIVPALSKVLSTTALVQETNDDTKLHLSVRDNVKVTNLMHSMESSMPKVVSALFVSEPIVPKQQSVPKFSLLDHQTNQIYLLKGQKEY
ncbi:hypothetical protein ACTXT7_006437 [Hymenolepis weldensis]